MSDYTVPLHSETTTFTSILTFRLTKLDDAATSPGRKRISWCI